jgi:hypothetical protein
LTKKGIDCVSMRFRKVKFILKFNSPKVFIKTECKKINDIIFESAKDNNRYETPNPNLRKMAEKRRVNPL